MRQRVSRTATVVALWRARESARSASTRLFRDPFAEAFVGWRLRCALQLSRLPLVRAALPWSLVDGHWDGSRGTVSVRTRYIDDALGGALCNGVEQVVIFGAGFDSRVSRSGEPYAFGFEPVELPQYLAALGLTLIEDVGADIYRNRYLTPLGRGHEPLSDFQRAALAEITDGRSGRAS
jgi:methyltransferase (TIGR00027 family)